MMRIFRLIIWGGTSVLSSTLGYIAADEMATKSGEGFPSFMSIVYGFGTILVIFAWLYWSFYFIYRVLGECHHIKASIDKVINSFKSTILHEDNIEN